MFFKQLEYANPDKLSICPHQMLYPRCTWWINEWSHTHRLKKNIYTYTHIYLFWVCISVLIICNKCWLACVFRSGLQHTKPYFWDAPWLHRDRSPPPWGRLLGGCSGPGAKNTRPSGPEMGVSQNSDAPKRMAYRENPMKMDHLGVFHGSPI